MSMDAVGHGVDGVGQGVDVSGFEFAQLAVLEEFGHDGMRVGKSCEDLLICGILPGPRLLRLFDELELIEENFAELLRGVEVKGATGCLVD